MWVLAGPRSSSSGCMVPVGDSEDLWSDPLLSLMVGAPLCPETAGPQASLLPVSQQPSLSQLHHPTQSLGASPGLHGELTPCWMVLPGDPDA